MNILKYQLFVNTSKRLLLITYNVISDMSTYCLIINPYRIFDMLYTCFGDHFEFFHQNFQNQSAPGNVIQSSIYLKLGSCSEVGLVGLH